jgi:chitinase
VLRARGDERLERREHALAAVAQIAPQVDLALARRGGELHAREYKANPRGRIRRIARPRSPGSHLAEITRGSLPFHGISRGLSGGTPAAITVRAVSEPAKGDHDMRLSVHLNASRLSLVAAVALAAAGCLGSPDPGDEGADTQSGELSGSCAQLPTWTPNVTYKTGAQVQYQGKAYSCLQGHTALSVWPPDIVPALWKEISTCSGGSSTTTSSTTSGSGGSTTSTTSSTTSGSGGAGGGTGGGGTGGGGGGTGGGTSSGTEYAPYFYTWGWGNSAYPFTSLADLKNKSGLSGVTLAFVLSNGGCAPTQDIQQHMSDVNAYRQSGGKLKASFGGADGTYLENACGDAGSLAQAIGSFVSQTGITDLDFDVEQGGAMTADVNARRAQALKMVQDQKGIKVAFTLAAFPRDKWNTPGGVTAPSLEVIKAAVQAGVTISHVNLMTMDYGGYYSNGKAMGDLAISALTDAKAQLQSVIPNLGDAAAWKMLGATPMIGQNDVSSEVFTLADAQNLAAFAKQKKLGLVAFWAINRDQPGSGSLGLYSGVNGGNFDFHKIFVTVTQ